MFNIKDIMEQAQGLQSRLAQLQGEMAAKVVTGTAGGDMVVVEANGALEILSVKIDKVLITQEDREMLEDLVAAAVNDSLRKAREMMAQEVSKLTGGMKLPGMGLGPMA
ncbi:MAG: YbaB/EbfC family nucleoid-associated protein [Pseudomonadota bacterium]